MMKTPLVEIRLPDLKLFDRGKVRDVFELGENLLVVTTDRIFAYDRVYPAGLAGKGKILTSLTVWAFGLVRDLIDNYVLASSFEEFPPSVKAYDELLEGRSLLVKKVAPIRLECVVRGFLYGQAWQAYRQGDFFWGYKPPAKMKLAQEFKQPLFTPARKMRSGDDENISWLDFEVLLGEERAEELRSISLKLYHRFREEWERRGFILADTKFEFGLVDERVVLINEVSTPDSSRFWRIADYRPGQTQDSWDKDILENYLRRKRWSPGSPPVPISDYIRRKMEERFRELLSLV